MTRTLALCGLLLPLVGCAKQRSPRLPPSEQVLSDWARSQLDLRTWRSCARSAEKVELEQAQLVWQVDAEGNVGPLVIEPEDLASDPAMICLAFELAEPPEQVPPEGAARTVRIRAGTVHEQPGDAL